MNSQVRLDEVYNMNDMEKWQSWGERKGWGLSKYVSKAGSSRQRRKMGKDSRKIWSISWVEEQCVRKWGRDVAKWAMCWRSLGHEMGTCDLALRFLLSSHDTKTLLYIAVLRELVTPMLETGQCLVAKLCCCGWWRMS